MFLPFSDVKFSVENFQKDCHENVAFHERELQFWLGILNYHEAYILSLNIFYNIMFLVFYV